MILTDSGGVQEETFYFQKPLIIMRNETERPETIENQLVKISGYDPKTIFILTDNFLRKPFEKDRTPVTTCVFGDGLASERIIKALYNWSSGESPALSDKEEFRFS